MTDLLHSFRWPWYVVTIFWLFIGGLIWHKGFRASFDGFLAHMMGLKPRKDK